MKAFEPVHSFYKDQKAYRFEADVHDCEVEGQIPVELNGTYYRAGPDTRYPTLKDDVIINGDGIVSMFRFENGNVDFRCRYVKTARYLSERKARRRLYGIYRNSFTDDPASDPTDRDNTANTFAFYHHGRLFALREDSLPHEIDPDTLDTLPTIDFDRALQSLAICAHPKIDPETGEWWSYSNFAKRQFDGDMALQVIDKNGKLIREEHFQAPYPGIAHDFAVSREHVIFPLMTLTVDMDRVRAGGDFYAYDDNLTSMWGIMPRSGTTEDIRWFSVPSICIGHIMNAWTEGNRVHVDATVTAGNAFPFFKTTDGHDTGGPMMATITRLTFHLDSNDDKVDQTPFVGAEGEMPRLDERFAMSRYRYGYMNSPTGVARIDWDTGERAVHVLPESFGGVQEPVFVPRTPDAPEGDGWLLCVISHHAENRAELLVLDALKITEAPVARVKLPFNQPWAFHGCFVPA